jgi:hypothetical protein
MEVLVTWFPGIQTPPPDRAVEPPHWAAFSTMTTDRPCSLAVIAVDMPAAPEPTTTTSKISLTATILRAS